MPGKLGKDCGNLGVVSDIARQHNRAAEFSRKVRHPVLKALADVGKSQFSALAVAAFCDAVSNRAIRNHARDQNAFTR
jgi:hypothetical protein